MSKNKKIFYGVVIVAILVVGGVSWYLTNRPITPPLIPPTEQPTQEVTITTDKTEYEQGEQIVNGVEYLMALGTANRFLSAGIHRDGETGYNLLSTHLKNLFPKEELSDAISGLSNPHHNSFEIFNPHYTEPNTYEFQIFFNEWYMGQQFELNLSERQPEILRVIKEGDGKWYIDSLPKAMALYIVDYNSKISQ